MKSAYELAMERLAASDPEGSVTLTPEQKAELADIDARYRARIAEREIFLKQKLAEAEAARNLQDIVQIERQIASERAGLEEDRESEKNRVRERARRR